MKLRCVFKQYDREILKAAGTFSVLTTFLIRLRTNFSLHHALPWIWMVGIVSSVWAASILWNLPPRNPHFVGREVLLKNIAGTLQKHATVVLTGGPGFGKTQATKQYAYQASQDYDIIWWFKADSTLSTQFKAFALALNGVLKEPQKITIEGVPFEKLLGDIKSALRKESFRCCLIFDEVEDFKTLRPSLPNPSPFIHILMSSRKKITPLQTLTVDNLKQEESIVFIKQLLPIRGA